MSSTRIVFAAAYAVRSSKCPASMLKIRVQGLIAGGVTLAQCAPPSDVVWITPSSVPAQRMLMFRVDGESAVIVPNAEGFTSAAYFPAFAGTAHVCRARSGLMRVQLWAWSVLFQTTFDT